VTGLSINQLPPDGENNVVTGLSINQLPTSTSLQTSSLLNPPSISEPSTSFPSSAPDLNPWDISLVPLAASSSRPAAASTPQLPHLSSGCLPPSAIIHSDIMSSVRKVEVRLKSVKTTPAMLRMANKLVGRQFAVLVFVDEPENGGEIRDSQDLTQDGQLKHEVLCKASGCLNVLLTPANFKAHLRSHMLDAETYLETLENCDESSILRTWANRATPSLKYWRGTKTTKVASPKKKKSKRKKCSVNVLKCSFPKVVLAHFTDPKVSSIGFPALEQLDPSSEQESALSSLGLSTSLEVPAPSPSQVERYKNSEEESHESIELFLANYSTSTEYCSNLPANHSTPPLNLLTPPVNHSTPPLNLLTPPANHSTPPSII